MSQIDTYRRIVMNKREEIARLKENLAKENARIPGVRKKIMLANDTINRTKSSTTINNKCREIEQGNKNLVEIDKKCSDIQKRIAQKEKELISAEKNLRSEEVKESKKRDAEEKKRTKEQLAQLNTVRDAVHQQALLQNTMRLEMDRIMDIPEKITVLFLASDPTKDDKLHLDEEVRAIHKKIMMSKYRDSIRFESWWAVRAEDILQALNETRPTIVHFSGHGDEKGNIVLMNPDGTPKYVSIDAMSTTISVFSDTVRLAVFNACYSESQAQKVVEKIEAAIGMKDSIYDDAAVTFSAHLYSAIGFGCSLKNSFEQAIAAIMLEGIPQENIPQLYCRDDANPNEIVLVKPD